MREALAGLTLRGKSFLAAGLTAIVCAIVAGQSDLVRAGVLIVVLPLIAVAVLARGNYRLTLHRELSTSVTSVGTPVDVSLTLHNEGRTPTGILRLEDQLPYALGTRPRFVLEGVARGWRRHVDYRVRSDVRGRYDIGPMIVRAGDPFGLVEMTRTFQTSTTLIVTPRIVSLPPISLAAGWTGAGDHRPRAFSVGSAEDLTVRTYQQGDDLRRVHWRSSARTGELMVRREEQPWQARATVLLDNRAGLHSGHGAGSSLEIAIVAAASVIAHLERRGYQVRLATVGDRRPPAWHERGNDTQALLEQLAVVETVASESLDNGWLSSEGQEGLLIAILGGVGESDVEQLRRIGRRASSSLALAVGARLDPRPMLARAGWRGAGVSRLEDLEQSWIALGRPVLAAAR